MSLDARYILKYETLPYTSPTPMEEDKEYLEENFGGEVIKIGLDNNYYYDKPKYKLLSEEIIKLKADQVLECEDCGLWKIIK